LRVDAAEEVLLDQNAMARGLAFLAVGEFEVSDDARRLLYSIDDTGFRQYTLFVKDLGTGVVQGPLAERVTSAAWASDDATIFYMTEDPITSVVRCGARARGQPEKIHENGRTVLARCGRTRMGVRRPGRTRPTPGTTG
jgi:oligopeptidase B